MIAIPRPQVPDPQELIANLREVEQITSAPPEEMLKWEDEPRLEIDKKAARLYVSTVAKIGQLQCLESVAIDRVLRASVGIKFFNEFSTIAEALSVHIPQVLDRAFKKLSGQEVVMSKIENIVGMKIVSIKARMVREALEQEMTNPGK